MNTSELSCSRQTINAKYSQLDFNTDKNVNVPDHTRRSIASAILSAHKKHT